MKTIVQHKYGHPDLLQIEYLEKPSLGDGEVLIKVRAASVNPEDWHRIRGIPYPIRLFTGLLKPNGKVPGIDVAGQVEEVGKNVSTFQPGDEVFGGCKGAFAEYACASENRIALKPAGLTFEQAAAIPVAGITALQGLRDQGRVQAGQKVLINGASGGVGTFSVQIAKAFGAHVTGVCSARNIDRIRSLGADEVINYDTEDFVQARRRYDLIVDNVVNRPLSTICRALTPNGTLVILGGGNGRWLGPLSPIFKAFFLKRFVRQKLVFFVARIVKEDLMTLAKLIEAGSVTPIVERKYPLSEVPNAIRYLEAGHAQGKVVISVE